VCCENRSGPADRASSVRNRTVRGSYRIRNAYDPVWPDVNQPVLDKIDDRSSCTLFLLKKIAKQRYFCGTLRFVILINDDFPSFPSSLSSFPKTQTRPRQNLATPFSISRPASHPNGFFPSSFHTVVADLHRWQSLRSARLLRHMRVRLLSLNLRLPCTLQIGNRWEWGCYERLQCLKLKVIENLGLENLHTGLLRFYLTIF